MNKSFLIMGGTLVVLLSASVFWAINQNSSKSGGSSDNKQPKNPSSVNELTAETAPLTIAKVPGLLVIDFYAEWCGPCRTLKPTFEEVAEELKDTYVFARVNIDHCKNIAQEYKIASIPTIIIFSNGKPIDTITGLVSKEVLIEKIKEASEGPKDLSTLSQEARNAKLIQAIQNNAPIEAIKKLLEAGADVNAPAATGLTPLMLVIVMNISRGIDPSELVKLLLDYGAATEFTEPQNNQTTRVADFIAMMIQNFKQMTTLYDNVGAVLANHDKEK